MNENFPYLHSFHLQLFKRAYESSAKHSLVYIFYLFDQPQPSCQECQFNFGHFHYVRKQKIIPLNFLLS